jgi:hypothetical protein
LDSDAIAHSSPGRINYREHKVMEAEAEFKQESS